MLNRYSVLPLRLTNYCKIDLLVVLGRQTLTTSNNKSHQPVFTEKCEEDPVLVVSENDDVDIIGPPNTLSNLRPIIRKKLLYETDLQHRLREMQNATQLWNQEFWATHNTNFIMERQEYINQRQVEGVENHQLSAEEMSDFYKSFLDKNWERHLKYNIHWYKRNFTLLVLAFKVCVEKSVSKLR